MKIQKSAEDYLEMILMLKEQKGYAAERGVTKPSVSYATKRLRENGYITMDPDGLISLTDAGYEIAFRMYGRHKMLTAFLVKLGVDRETAREDACKMEHDISENTFSAMCLFLGWPREKG